MADQGAAVIREKLIDALTRGSFVYGDRLDIRYSLMFDGEHMNRLVAVEEEKTKPVPMSIGDAVVMVDESNWKIL